MADIAFSNVTFSVVRESKPGGVRSLREVEATIAFGDNVLTYPTGGVPITGKAHLGVTEATRACRSLGFPTELVDLLIIDQGANAAGYKFEWDRANNKLKVYVSGSAAPTFTGSALASHTHDLRIIGGQAAAGTDTVQGAVGDLILGKEEASNALIAGADQATKGGVVGVTGGTPAGTISAIAAAKMAEHANSTFVPNPATLRVIARGF